MPHKRRVYLSEEDRKNLADTVYEWYLEGKSTPGRAMFFDCQDDPQVYGLVIQRVKEYVEKKSVVDNFMKEVEERKYEFSHPKPTEPSPSDEKTESWVEWAKSGCCCRRKGKKAD